MEVPVLVFIVGMFVAFFIGVCVGKLTENNSYSDASAAIRFSRIEGYREGLLQSKKQELERINKEFDVIRNPRPFH